MREFPAEATKKIGVALDEAGADGWEVTTSWGIKKGIGRDTAAIVLKRPLNED